MRGRSSQRNAPPKSPGANARAITAPATAIQCFDLPGIGTMIRTSLLQGAMGFDSQRERHFRGSETVRDVVIGMSDGLPVPFALAAGLSGAVGSSTVVVTAGLAEIAAGSIAMGLGGYLAARSYAEHYSSERL